MTTFRRLATVLALLACSLAARSADATLPASRFVSVDLSGGTQAGVASIVKSSDGTWWAAGSFRDDANEHRPGLWRSSDTITWTRIETVAVTPYGEVSELYSVGERFHAEPGVSSSADTDAIAWTSPEGESWKRWTPPGLRLGGRDIQRGQRIAVDGTRVLIAGADDRSLRNRIGTWTTDNRKIWTRTVIAAFGSSDDPTTAVTAARANVGRMIVGARVTGRLRAVVSTNGRRWTELSLPTELPTGNRAILATELDATTILIGATSLDGGGLWRGPVR